MSIKEKAIREDFYSSCSSTIRVVPHESETDAGRLEVRCPLTDVDVQRSTSQEWSEIWAQIRGAAEHLRP